jgi:hypothetical protein
LTGEQKDLAITETFVKTEKGTRFAKISSILDVRCVRCHNEGSSSQAFRYPLRTWGEVAPYTRTDTATGKSLSKLALTTHVHLLGFSMLYGLTGLVFAFTSYPGIVRLVIAPLPLLAQIVDISFWWLARLDEPWGPMFARAIIVSGGIVGAGLALQIVLSLFNLFNKTGKLVMLLVFGVGVAIAAWYVAPIVIRHLESEKPAKVALRPQAQSVSAGATHKPEAPAQGPTFPGAGASGLW